MPRLFALLLTALLTLPLRAAEPAPNFVVIFIDDLGYGDIGPFGATKQKTPHLDRMAREGMRLTSFYAAPVCSVSRAQLMTGCYGARVSVPGVFFPGQPNGLNPAEFTVAERLKERGYATQMVGKWHLGDQPAFLPTRQGFDHYLGIPYSNDMQKVPVAGGPGVVPLLRDDKVAELLPDEAQSRITERYTDEALAFIRARRDTPFFLYFAHTAVHTPVFPGAAFQGKSANGRFGDWVEEVDWSVGRVLDTLRELKLDERTLVIFTTDNGPWLSKGADGGSAGPLRDGKGSTWEGGVRVPTVAWWPGKVPAGTSCDTVAGTIDVLPTFVTLAGGTVPAEPKIDGKNIAPILLGQSRESPREAHYYFSQYNLQAVRQGPWKLALVPQRNAFSGVKDDPDQNPMRLYHLDQDIGERTNVAARNPEVVARLQALAAAMEAEIGGKEPSARRPAGVQENPVTLYPTAVPKKPAAKAGVGKDGKAGETRSGADAPAVGGKAFTVKCEFETKQTNAQLLAHGGLAAGYALRLRDGKVVFQVRHDKGDAGLTELTAPATVTGRDAITASLAADGTLTLRLNDAEPVTAKSPGPLPRQPAEDYCLGHDNAAPVGRDAAPAFDGTHLRVTVTAP